MAILPPGSWPFGYVIEYSSRNFLAASSVSWVLMPRNTTPSSLYFRHASSNTRASARHGGHHEAQKLRKTIFPLKSSRRIVDPSKSPSVNAGAGRAMRGERMSLGSRPKPYASRARIATAGPRIAPRRASRLVNDCSSAAWRSDAPRDPLSPASRPTSRPLSLLHGGPMDTAIHAPYERAVHRRRVDLVRLLGIHGDRGDILRTIRRRCPPPAAVRAPEDAVAHRDVHHVRVRRIDGESVDRSRGQTAHCLPPSEAVRISLKALRGPGVQVNATHAGCQVDRREHLRLPAGSIVDPNPLLPAVRRPIHAFAFVPDQGVQLVGRIRIDGEPVDVKAPQAAVHFGPRSTSIRCLQHPRLVRCHVQDCGVTRVWRYGHHIWVVMPHGKADRAPTHAAVFSAEEPRVRAKPDCARLDVESQGMDVFECRPDVLGLLSRRGRYTRGVGGDDYTCCQDERHDPHHCSVLLASVLRYVLFVDTVLRAGLLSLAHTAHSAHHEVHPAWTCEEGQDAQNRSPGCRGLDPCRSHVASEFLRMVLGAEALPEPLDHWRVLCDATPAVRAVVPLLGYLSVDLCHHVASRYEVASRGSTDAESSRTPGIQHPRDPPRDARRSSGMQPTITTEC